ncbi:MAG: ATP-dependent DNA ligase [Vicinamibacteraceae bacterium]
MKAFADLFAALDGTTPTNAKVLAIVRYLAAAPAGDAAWAVFFLTGRRLKRLLPYRAISAWTLVLAGLDEWLLGECYAVVGDGAETATLILDQIDAVPGEPLGLAEWVEGRILPLRQAPPEAQQRLVIGWIRELGRWERFTLFKLLTGELRLGVSQTLVVRAVAQAAALPATTIAARLMGEWTPTAAWFADVLSPDVTDVDRSRPYPFCLAAPIDNSIADAPAIAALLDGRSAWQAEWKWDGIRAQLIVRGGRVYLWSRGEELITDRFPEVAGVAAGLADGTVLDGEILAWRGDRPMAFSALQQRIGRERQVARTARDIPVVFMVYDVLEDAGVDVRATPLIDRRVRLEALVAGLRPVAVGAPAAASATKAPLLPFEDDPTGAAGLAQDTIRLSPVVTDDTWEALATIREESRPRGVEGLMLKRLTSAYGVGRKRGDWWKWKVDPHTIDAVLIYAQPGSGKRASLLTDYTFGVWHEGELVPVAKAYSGLTNEEILEMDRWIRRHTVERFGPVRHVEPIHVFELGFEAIAASTRHRSGIAVRFPRMLRWRKDKPASEADTLATLEALMHHASGSVAG